MFSIQNTFCENKGEKGFWNTENGWNFSLFQNGMCLLLNWRERTGLTPEEHFTEIQENLAVLLPLLLASYVFSWKKKKKNSLFFNSSVSPDQHLFLDNWVGSTPCVHIILSIFKPRSRWNVYLRIRPHVGVNTEIAHEGRSNGMHGFSPYSTQTFYVIMDRNWALVYKGTVPRLFSTTRDVHVVHLLSWMVGMIWGEPNVSPDR